MTLSSGSIGNLDAVTPLSLVERIRPLLTRVESLYSRHSLESQLSRVQLSIMIILEAPDACHINQLVEVKATHMPTASNVTHRLEVVGMVEHVRDSRDRYGVRAELIDRGREELHHVPEGRSQQMAKMFSVLTQEELESDAGLETILSKILENRPEHLKTNPGV